MVQTFTVCEHDNRLTIDTVRKNADWTTGALNLDPFDPASISLMESARQIGVRGDRSRGVLNRSREHQGVAPQQRVKIIRSAPQVVTSLGHVAEAVLDAD